LKKIATYIAKKLINSYKLDLSTVGLVDAQLDEHNANQSKNENKQATNNEIDLTRIEKIFVEKSNALANDLEKITEQMVDFGELVKNTQVTIKDVCEHSITNLTSSQNALTQLKNLEESAASLQNLADHLQNLEHSNSEVMSVSSSMKSIVLQTKLLSFNADTEAVKAGAAGRTFSVIAESIRELGGQTGKFSIDINRATKSNMETIDKSIQFLSKLKDDYLTVSSSSSKEVYDVVTEIQHSSEQLTSIDQTLEQTLKTLESIITNTRNKVEQNAAFVSDIIGELRGRPIVNLTVHQAYEDLSRFQIIDVRRDQEYCDELGHIESSQLETIDESFKNKINKYDKNAETLFVCRSGGRSARAARIAQEIGLQNVYNLEGGMLAWCDKNLSSIGKKLKSS
jgi:rhodanese-related sulfurtransferase